MAGRIEAALRYSQDGRSIVAGGCHGLPHDFETTLFGAYIAIGQPARAADFCRARLRDSGPSIFTRIGMVFALAMAGVSEEAMAATDGLIGAAESTANPLILSYALHAYGFALRDADPDRALNALRRGLAVAQDSGNRANETHIASMLCQLESRNGNPLAALDYFAMSISHYFDSGNPTLYAPLASLVTCLDRLGRYQPAAIIGGFACGSPMAGPTISELDTVIAHLRKVLGSESYGRLVRRGEAMTTAATVAYAMDQIDQARAELTVVSGSEGI